jgi:hypothetical protein
MMNMHRKFFGSLLAGAISLGTASWCQSQNSHEQRVFNAESRAVDHPVAIPSEVLNLLSEDKDVIQVMGSQNISLAGPAPKDWFSACIISRANLDEKLYLVIGNGPLTGAHATTFWLVKSGRGEAIPTVLFKITADQLKIGKTEVSGYPSITVVRFTATSVTDAVYNFVSGKYVLLHSTK